MEHNRLFNYSALYKCIFNAMYGNIGWNTPHKYMSSSKATER